MEEAGAAMTPETGIVGVVSKLLWEEIVVLYFIILIMMFSQVSVEVSNVIIEYIPNLILYAGGFHSHCSKVLQLEWRWY